MQKTKLLATALAAAAFSITGAHADVNADMEKCRVVNSEGVGAIKAHMGQCGTSAHSCAGQSQAGDPEAWIMLPKGECEKVNMGDFSGLTDEMKDKIDMELMQGTKTTESSSREFKHFAESGATEVVEETVIEETAGTVTDAATEAATDAATEATDGAVEKTDEAVNEVKEKKSVFDSLTSVFK